MDIPAGVFKAKCLKLMDEVRLSHREVVITKHGRPVAKLVPTDKSSRKSVFGFLKGAVKVKGDIVSSIGGNWNADR